MGLDLYGSDGSVATFYHGASGCGPAVENIFSGYKAVIKVVSFYCDNCGDKIERPRANQTTCGGNNCQQAISRNRRNNEPWIPYFNIKLNCEFLLHVMMTSPKGNTDCAAEGTTRVAMVNSAERPITRK